MFFGVQWIGFLHSVLCMLELMHSTKNPEVAFIYCLSDVYVYVGAPLLSAENTVWLVLSFSLI